MTTDPPGGVWASICRTASRQEKKTPLALMSMTRSQSASAVARATADLGERRGVSPTWGRPAVARHVGLTPRRSPSRRASGSGSLARRPNNNLGRQRPVDRALVGDLHQPGLLLGRERTGKL